MKNTYFTLLLIITFLGTGFSQTYNPFVNNPSIVPSPLNLPANNATGQLSFTFGLSTSDNAPLVMGDELTLIISLQLIEPLTMNPIASIGGTYESFFDWQYDAITNSFQGTQNQVLPGADGGTIIIDFAVTGESTDAMPQNGFAVNIQPAAYMNATNTTTDDNISSYTYTDPGAPLPVELTSFKGQAKDCSVALSWSTATELHNSHFEVEHSTTGKNFVTLKKVMGAGTTVEPQNYSFLHEDAAPLNYYHLKQVDTDGAFEYSETILVQTNCRTSGKVTVFPNLTKEEPVNVQVQTELQGNIYIEVVDGQGKRILMQKTAATAGYFTEQIDVHNLTPGTYYIFVTGQGWSSEVQSFVKMNK